MANLWSICGRVINAEIDMLRRHFANNGITGIGGGRYFTVTGDKLDDVPAEVLDCQEALDGLVAELWSDAGRSNAAERLTDADIGMCEEHARDASVAVATELSVYEGRRATFGTTLVRGNFKTRYQRRNGKPAAIAREIQLEHDVVPTQR